MPDAVHSSPSAVAAKTSARPESRALLVLTKTIENSYIPYSLGVANISGYLIMVEMPNKSRPEINFGKYADLCFWWSYNLLLQENTGGAVEWWDRGFTMYNGTGFKDWAFYKNITSKEEARAYRRTGWLLVQG